MSPTYMTCSECGKRALSIATRCPQCGFEFPARPIERRSWTSDLGRLLVPVVTVGVIAGTVAVVTVVVRRTASRAEGRATAEAPASAAAAEMDTATAAASPAASAGERRFARTWTKVRSRRSVAGNLVGVLLPGDTVLVDSLNRGWWRVTFEGKVMGYTYHSALVTDPPPVRP
jgi:ribosomal protein L37E